MEFRILGPLEAISGGRALELGGAKQRTLLAMLLLHANSAVSVDRLIDALWEDDPPENAQKALQVHVSALRKVVGRDRLETTPAGYRLHVREDELDLEQFRRLQAEDRLAEALAVWRGPPLPDFAYHRFARAETARLEDERLACLEKRVERDLAAGRHAELTGELEALVAEHPLREPLRRQLMLALYRSGRQAQALEAYQEARSALVEELGIEPSRELRELHQAILNQDPALDLAAPEGEAEPEVSPPTAEPEPPPTPPTSARQARKTVTALFVGIAATADGGEALDPEARKRVNERAFRAVEDAVARHGGTVDAFSDEGLAAVFGLPVLHDDDALRAVRAADEARRALLQVGEEPAPGTRLEARIGIGTGEVVTAELGPGLRAVGEPLTASARLARSAAHGEILLDRATWRLVRDAAAVEPEGPALRLLEVSRELRRPATRLDAPMVGRERESRRLQQAFEQAVGDGSCQLFTVLGAAGVGKSRLVQEFLAAVAGEALVARGRCLPYGEGITYWPLLEAVKEAVGLDDAVSSEAAQAALADALSAMGAEAHARRLAELIGLAEARGGAEAGPAAVLALFEALAERQPLVLVFDDIHWAEPTFLDLIEFLADWLRQAPVLLICLARPELLEVRPGWAGGKLNATSILLEPLSDDESAELVENLASSALPGETRRRIVEASEGNPLFVEEMLALALEGGDLVVPPTIQALLAARLDRLGEAERAVLDVAAVQGKVFNEDAVTALLGPAYSEQAAGALASAAQKELIRPDRPILGRRTYRFRHLLIRDAAYDSIAKEARAELHERFARWLESAAGDRTGEYEEIVGYHLEQAYRYRVELGALDDIARALGREAAEHLAAAGRRAFVRSDAPAGVNLVSRAAELLPPEDPLRIDLIPNVRVVQGLGADMAWADRVLTEAVEAAATTGDRGLAAHALVQRGLLRLFTDPEVTVAELLDAARRAIAVFGELGDELGLARGWRLTAQAHYLDRDLAACAEASEQALGHARRAGDRFEQREIVEWLVIALFLGPMPATKAAERCRRLLAETAGDPFLKVQVLGGLAFLTAIQGRTREARELLAEARSTMDELGEWLWILSWHVAFTSLLEADPAAAEREIRPAYEALKQIGEKSHFSTMAHALALSLYQQERYEEAEALARECEEAARANDVNSKIASRGVRAKALARRGRLEEAEAVARDAVRDAARSDCTSARADALLDLATVLALAGRRSEAAAPLRDALTLYERKEHVLGAGRARKRLAELQEQPAT